MSSKTREGGCLCGDLRLTTRSDPVRVIACHCATCKKRTGAAFGISIYFEEADVTFTAGAPQQYEFNSDTSGRWIRNDHCPRCGTTVSWTLEMRPGMRGVAGGSFDDPTWFHIDKHIWTHSACDGIAYPDDAEVHERALPVT